MLLQLWYFMTFRQFLYPDIYSVATQFNLEANKICILFTVFAKSLLVCTCLLESIGDWRTEQRLDLGIMSQHFKQNTWRLDSNKNWRILNFSSHSETLMLQRCLSRCQQQLQLRKTTRSSKKKVQMLMKKTYFTEAEINRLLDIHYQMMVSWIVLRSVARISSSARYLDRNHKVSMQSWIGRSFDNFCMKTSTSLTML